VDVELTLLQIPYLDLRGLFAAGKRGWKRKEGREKGKEGKGQKGWKKTSTKINF